MKIVYLIFTLLVTILAVIFAVSNSMVVDVKFFSWSTTGSLSLLLVVALVIGILIGVLIMLPSVVRHSFKSSGLKRKLIRAVKEKEKLKENSLQKTTTESSEVDQPEKSEQKG